MLNDPKATSQQKYEAVGQVVTPTVMGILGAFGTIEELHPDAKAIFDQMKDKTPKEAANVLREHANDATDPQQENALNHAASTLENITPNEPTPATVAAKEVAPAPFVQAKEWLAGIKNESVDAELDQMGMEPATHGEKLSFQAAVKNAEDALAKDPEAGGNLVDELEKKPRPVTGNEDALLLHEMTKRKIARDQAEQAFIEAEKSGDVDKKAEAMPAWPRPAMILTKRRKWPRK